MTDHRVGTDRGAGLVGTSAGFLVFLLLMLTSVQILFNLYANSMVTAAAHDAAREVAGFAAAADRCVAATNAEVGFTEALGDYGDGGYASLTWVCTDPAVVSVQVIADHPTILPPRMAGLISLGHLDRTITIRIEEFQ